LGTGAIVILNRRFTIEEGAMIGGVLMFTASLLIAVVLLAMLHPTGRTPGQRR
jgi:hypothetical protein